MKIHHRQHLADELLDLLEANKNAEGQISFNQDLKQKIHAKVASSSLPHQIAETKHLSILLSDLRGFTAIAERHSPLRVIELLNRYFSRMSEIIDANGGTIDKFMGDSIMVLFGVARQQDNELHSAIKCAIEMQIAMTEINKISHSLGLSKLYMGIGINSGEVVAGTLGSDIYREYTVIGDQVNLASRVEAHSLRGQILLTENSFLQAQEYIAVGAINEVLIKGKTDPVKMYELIAVTQPELLQVPAREVRKSPRVEINLPLVYQILDRKQVLPEKFSAKVLDISYGGLFILTEKPLTDFSEIKLQLSLPLAGAVFEAIYAKVLRCELVNGQHQAHLEFTSVSEQNSQEIKNFVDQLV